MIKLTNKTILITGATGGFGQEFTKQLFSKGNQLILADIDHEKLQSFADEFDSESGAGRIVTVLASDLSTADGASQLFEQVQALVRPYHQYRLVGRLVIRRGLIGLFCQ